MHIPPAFVSFSLAPFLIQQRDCRTIGYCHRRLLLQMAAQNIKTYTAKSVQ